MSNISRFPQCAKVRVEADIPISQRDEFEQAMAALQMIETAINAHPSTGGARRWVRFLAGVYNGQAYPLRAFDTELANACLDYLNYDRLDIREVHEHLANGDRDPHRWLEAYGIKPVQSAR